MKPHRFKKIMKTFFRLVPILCFMAGSVAVADRITPKELDRIKRGIPKKGILTLCPGEKVKVLISSEYQSDERLQVTSASMDIADASDATDTDQKRYVVVTAGANNTGSSRQTGIDISTTYVRLGGDASFDPKEEARDKVERKAGLKLIVNVLPKNDPRCAPTPGKTASGPKPATQPEAKKPGRFRQISKRICIGEVLYLEPSADINSPRAKGYRFESTDLDRTIAPASLYSHPDKPPKLVVVGKGPGTIRIDVTETLGDPDNAEGRADSVAYLIDVVSCTGPTAPKKTVVSPGEGYAEVAGTSVSVRSAAGPTDRKEKAQDQKIESAPNGQLKNKVIGIVLPADARRGERISGSVVMDPEPYKSTPGLTVVEVSAPVMQTGGQVTLEGLVLDTGDGEPQRTDEAIVFALPEMSERIQWTLSRSDNPDIRIPGELPVSGGFSGCCSHLGNSVICPPGLPPDSSSVQFVDGGTRWITPDGQKTFVAGSGFLPCTPPGLPSNTFEASPIVQPGIHALRGPFDGNGRETKLQIGDRPVRVVAESPRSCFMEVPSDLPAGSTEIRIAEEERIARIPVSILRLALSADRLELLRGESTRFQVVVSGPETLPDFAWSGGLSGDLFRFEELSKFLPGLKLPHQGGKGMILLHIQNGSPNVITMKDSKEERIIFVLNKDSFADGPYRYSGTLKSRMPGGFVVNAVAVPFLASLKAEQGVLPEDPTTPLTDKLANDLQESAAYWRQQAEKARERARKASDSEDRKYWEDEAKWNDANADRRDRIAEKLRENPYPGTPRPVTGSQSGHDSTWFLPSVDSFSGVNTDASIQTSSGRAEFYRKEAEKALRYAANETNPNGRKFWEEEAKESLVRAIENETRIDRLKRIAAGGPKRQIERSPNPEDPCDRERRFLEKAEDKLEKLVDELNRARDDIEDQHAPADTRTGFEQEEGEAGGPTEPEIRYERLKNEVISARSEMEAARKAFIECLSRVRGY